MKRQNINWDFTVYLVLWIFYLLDPPAALGGECYCSHLFFRWESANTGKGVPWLRDAASTECWDQDSQPRLPDTTVHVPTPPVHSISPGSSRAWRVYPLLSPLMAHAICGLGLWTPEFWAGCESSGRIEGSWCLTEVSICFRETSRKSRRWLNLSDLKLASYQLWCGPFGRLLPTLF